MAKDMAEEVGESKTRKRKTARNPDHFYQRNATDFRDGTRKLSLAARGAYNDLVDLMYIHGGPIEDDDFAIACELRVKMKQWRAVRAEILASGKLTLVDGFIHNERADEELSKRAAQRLLRSSRKSARPLLDGSSKAAEKQDEGNDNDINGGGAEKTSSSTGELASKKAEGESEDRKTRADSKQSDAGLAGSSDAAVPMIADIRSWMAAGAGTHEAAQWLGTLVGQYGEAIVREAYLKLKTDIAAGGLMVRKLQVFASIAKRLADEAAEAADPPADWWTKMRNEMSGVEAAA